MIVWAEESEIGWSILGALVDPDGQLIPPGVFFINAWDATQNDPDVAWDGSDYVVVYMDARNYAGSGEDVYASRVAPDGAVADPVGFPVTRAASDQDYPRVACGEGRCLTIWDDARNAGPLQTYGAWIDGETVSPADAFPVCAPPCEHRVASNRLPEKGGRFRRRLDGCPPTGRAASLRNDRYAGRDNHPSRGDVAFRGWGKPPAVELAADPAGLFGVWSKLAGWVPSHDDIVGAFLTNDLHAAGDPASLVFQVNEQFLPRVAWGEGSGLIVWRDFRFLTYAAEIYATRVSPDGGLLDVPPIPIYTGGDAWYAEVAYGAGNYLVVYKDPRLVVPHFFTLIAPDGTNLYPGGAPLFTDYDDADKFVLAFNGTDFVIVYELTDWDYPVSDYINTRLIAADGSWHSPIRVSSWMNSAIRRWVTSPAPRRIA
ncbi:MAG: hypothetical protein M5R36_18905 [Deltaproteobacteria bacterium]|nr:hypothetical protein [Deltaproteobacteria bacterium]